MSKKIKYHIEQRNRYLDDIGMEPSDYGVNCVMDGPFNRPDEYYLKRQRKAFGPEDTPIEGSGDLS